MSKKLSIRKRTNLYRLKSKNNKLRPCVKSKYDDLYLMSNYDDVMLMPGAGFGAL